MNLNKFKDYISDSFSFAQYKFLRKWYGGKWTKISVVLRDGKSTIAVWVKGEPNVKYNKVLEVEKWVRVKG